MIVEPRPSLETETESQGDLRILDETELDAVAGGSVISNCLRIMADLQKQIVGNMR